MSGPLKGALTGAVIGALGRGVLALVHLSIAGKDAVLAAIVAAVIGAVIGAIAGVTTRPIVGVVVGAGLSLLIYFGTLPVVTFVQSLGAGTTPSVLEPVAVGVVSGGVGAYVGRRGRGPAAPR